MDIRTSVLRPIWPSHVSKFTPVNTPYLHPYITRMDTQSCPTAGGQGTVMLVSATTLTQFSSGQYTSTRLSVGEIHPCAQLLKCAEYIKLWIAVPLWMHQQLALLLSLLTACTYRLRCPWLDLYSLFGSNYSYVLYLLPSLVNWLSFNRWSQCDS